VTLGADGAYGHPDHLAVHRWVVDAWRAVGPPRPPLLFAAFTPGLFVPQYEKCIAMMGDPPDPPAHVIGAARIDYELAIRSVVSQKRAALAAHRSQLPAGDPAALFPPGIVAALLEVERFTDADGHAVAATRALLTSLADWELGTGN
jgi:N-acetyl-1-D-myo-inositol-2-amino-2-deoxy-alpha-D-glucopyranoside deacetylase